MDHELLINCHNKVKETREVEILRSSSAEEVQAWEDRRKQAISNLLGEALHNPVIADICVVLGIM